MEEAGLTDLLKQEGSYTIFAPTDEAFDGLTPEDFELLKSEHPAKYPHQLQNMKDGPLTTVTLCRRWQAM